MKLTALLLMAASLNLTAGGFSRNVTLHGKDMTLEHIILAIKAQTGLEFLYNDAVLKHTKKISLDVKDAPVSSVLDECLKGQHLRYYVKNDIIVITIASEPLALTSIVQPATPGDEEIRGTIQNEKGQPLQGVTIRLTKTGASTVTDASGRFTIRANRGDLLELSYVGYATTIVKIGSADISFNLQPKNAELNEVVVVGYGTQKKVNLTGAVSVVKGSSLENRPVTNATQSLEGMVPGLNVSVAGGTKPGSSYNLNIRGTGNLSSSDQPYVLVDGLAMSLSDVNPNDIESISVLKDAAASAVYGARAPYGVILVTTKKGKADKTTLSYSDNMGLTSPIKLPDMVNSYQFAQFFNAATYNATGSKQYSDAKLALLQQYIKNPAGMNIFPEVNDNWYSNWENTANGVANTNWFKFHYKPDAFRQNHNLSASGGNKTTQYYLSGGYYSEGGTMRFADINYDRYNFNANLSSQLSSWARVKLNAKYVQSVYSAPFSGTFESLFFHDLARMRPNVSPYDLNGHYSEMSFVPYLQSGSNDKVNSYNIALLPGLELEPVKNWKINADLNLLRSNAEEDVLLLPGIVYGVNGAQQYVNRSEFNIPLSGSYARNLRNINYLSPNIYTSYNYSLKDHNFGLMAGFQQELNTADSLNSTTQNLISFSRPGLMLSTANGSQTTTERRTHWGTQGFFGRLNYNYRGKYLLEVDGRYDGSSRFAANNRWGFFPSASAGYNIAAENFMQKWKNQVSLLKVRGSYGLLGNQSGAALYSFAQTMNVTVPGPSGTGSQWYYPDGREAYIGAPAPYNPNLTWEKVLSSNIGVDFQAVNDHLSGTFDLYQRSTRDMLGPALDIADMYGGTPPATNNANLRTNGWELVVNWKGTLGKDIHYSIGGTLADYKSVVTKYQNPTKTNPANSWYEGKRVGEIWGYKTHGLIQNSTDAAAFNALNHSYLTAVNWVPGDVNYLDLNHDGKIDIGKNVLGDMGDLRVIGNTTPRYAYSFTGSLDWKGLGLSFMLQGIGKADYGPAPGDAYFWGAGALAQVTVFKQHMDYWTPTNTRAYYPNPYSAPAGSIATYTNKTQQVSDRYLQDASYLRVKNITLSYSLPARLLRPVRLSKVNIFASGENLFTITKLAKMMDPETITGGYAPGKIYPLSKVVSFGLNVSL